MLSTHERALSRRGPASRMGIAAVELAFCLPVLILIVWGALDLANMLHTRNASQAVAYHAVAKAALEGGTDSQVVATANSLLAQRGITGATVTVTHPTVSGLGATQVSIRVPPQTNLSGSWLYSGTIEVKCLALNQSVRSP